MYIRNHPLKKLNSGLWVLGPKTHEFIFYEQYQSNVYLGSNNIQTKKKYYYTLLNTDHTILHYSSFFFFLIIIIFKQEYIIMF